MMSWSNEQQRLLRAMGYVLYAQAGATMPASAPVPVTSAVAKSEPSRLLHSLQHVVPGRDVSALVVDVTALRGNPGAKRALWPKLRALRRPH